MEYVSLKAGEAVPESLLDRAASHGGTGMSSFDG